jgi:hypothetical protein
MEQIQKGLYEHYKGKRYEVLDMAIHTETQEPMVIYKALYKGDFPEGTLWARPLAMFKEIVTVNGKSLPRFKFLAASP